MKNVIKSVVLGVGILMTAQVASAQQKIGHINSQELIQLTPEFKTAETQLRQLGEVKQKELQDMYAQYQKKQTEANEKALNRSEANKATVDAEINTIVEEIRGMEERIQEVQRVAQEDMQKKEEELFAPIRQKVVNAINAVAKEKGYAYVLDLASGSVFYFDGGDDLTPDIKAKLGIS